MQVIEPEEVDSAIIVGAFEAIRPKMTNIQFEQLRQHFGAKDHVLPNDELGHLSPIIMSYGKIGGAISRHLNLTPKKYKFRWLMTDRLDPGNKSFSWHLHRNVVEALRLTGWFPAPRRSALQVTSTLNTMQEVLRELELGVAVSTLDDRANRLIRLLTAPQKPEHMIVTTTAFRRNPDVVAEVLYRAAGTCESCAEPAPFARAKDGSPYLEVHHLIPLSHDGNDTLENAIAVCPNCHRKMHYA